MVESDVFESIVESLTELQNDSSVPKNVKFGIQQTIEALKQSTDPSIKISRALNKLEGLADDANTHPYTRMQILNVVSLLETAMA